MEADFGAAAAAGAVETGAAVGVCPSLASLSCSAYKLVLFMFEDVTFSRLAFLSASICSLILFFASTSSRLSFFSFSI